MGITRFSILIFVALVAVGPLYTAPGYSPVSNVISELAAQNTPGNRIMSAGFLLLGLSILLDGLRSSRLENLPYVFFALFFGMAGLFGHRPINPDLPFVAWVDSVHSVLATLSGISLTIGFTWQGIRGHALRFRAFSFALSALCIILPLLMLTAPAYQGLTQRFMYLCVFGWLWLHYPLRPHA